MSPPRTLPHEATDATSASGSGNEKHSARNPACDACRDKKIRCGREKPSCNSCSQNRVECTYSERQKRDNEASRNASRFEEVHDRLDRIESTMSRLVAALEASTSASSKSSSVTLASPTPSSDSPITIVTSAGGVLSRDSIGTMGTSRLNSIPRLLAKKGNPMCINFRDRDETPPRPTNKKSENDRQYLGPLSLLSITSEAESLAEEKLRSQQSQTDRTEQTKAMGELQKLSSMAASFTTLAPRYDVQEILKGARERESTTLTVPPREDADMLIEEYFRKVYPWLPIINEAEFKKEVDQFYADPQSMAHDRSWMACFYNLLLFGVFDKFANTPFEKRDEIDPHGNISVYFFCAWAALDDLDVFLRPRLRSVQALLMGAVVAIEVSRPGLCWSFLSQAARLAQAIGLHRDMQPSRSITKAQLEERKLVYWNIYTLDKCLSLTFGRPTCLPDSDADVELPEDDGTNPYFQNLIALIYLSKIQSNIYTRLYSAGASKMSDSDRDKVIRELDAELREWWAKWKGMIDDMPNVNSNTLATFEQIERRFAYHCSLTLVHRMARPGMPSYPWSERMCLESARESIRTVNDVILFNNDLASCGVLLWLFQYYPFTSFFVLFSNIIRNPAVAASRDDYGLMKTLNSYLERMSEKNEGAAKLLSIASAFTHVAGTFLKNYRKVMDGGEEQAQQHHGLKRKADEPLVPDPRKDLKAWPGFRRDLQKPFGGVVAFPGEMNANAIPFDEVDDGRPQSTVDLQAAAFLKWPSPEFPDGGGSGGGSAGELQQPSPEEVEISTGAAGEAVEEVLDWEALMDQPLGFQMQMEQAAMRGPLEFDWFSWDGQFG